MMEKKKPTANCIVARLVPSWGSRVSLLFKATEPYEHYYDENGEEVPNAAIVSWTDVELPPESEDEDERIRKWLVNYFKAVGKSWIHRDISPERILSYLERQKENPDRLILIGKAKSEKQVVLLAESNGDENIYWDTKSEEDAVSLLEKGLKFFGKQKEQKPAEWSEEDKKMLGKVLECIRFAEDRYQLEEEQMNGVSIKLWLLDHITPQPHWKPSEEQMKALENLIKCELSAGMHTRAGILQTLQNDLKKL